MKSVPELISEAMKQGKSRFAFEMLPPLKGDGFEKVTECVDSLIEFNPAYINITCHRESTLPVTLSDGSVQYHKVHQRPGTVGISSAIQKKYDITVVPHLICAGNSKYDIEDQLIDFSYLGLDNVLALRGDKLRTENSFVPVENGYAYAVDVVRQIANLNRGKYVDFQSDHRFNFSIGVAGYPETHLDAESAEKDIENLKAKVDAGAQYIVTQLFYENKFFFDFVRRCREAGISVPIIPGIKPLSTVNHLTVLPKFFGCHIPEELEKEVLAHKDNSQAVRQIGAEWAIAQSEELIAAGVPILHYYPMGKADNIISIAKKLF
ncbi:MAG: methylenetetrahydrofolate reductase [Bacteroidales bacterium]|nr:methylenetetrahydrofolate reductase [Bacteroidales bacterium]